MLVMYAKWILVLVLVLAAVLVVRTKSTRKVLITFLKQHGFVALITLILFTIIVVGANYGT